MVLTRRHDAAICCSHDQNLLGEFTKLREREMKVCDGQAELRDGAARAIDHEDQYSICCATIHEIVFERRAGRVPEPGSIFMKLNVAQDLNYGFANGHPGSSCRVLR
jgi:hypothetical protein